MRQRKLVCLTVLALLALCCSSAVFSANKTAKTSTPPSTKLSHIRAVRLSFVQGTVTLRRAGDTEWTPATVNTPIQEGFALATTKRSFAEVQFENGSTVRLGDMSSVTFTQLALTQQGGHINRLTLDDGYATMNVVPEKHDQYVLTASSVTLTPQGQAEFRADLNPDKLRVEILNGHVLAADAGQTEKFGKNRVLTVDVDAGSAAAFQVADKLQKDDWDKWTEARDRQSVLAYDNSAVDISSAPTYGWEDLVAYGDWAYFPGFGYGWAPYESLGWSPYTLGAWNWYPGWGYTWISGEPWGWLPFHYGYWNFSPVYGWFWMAGSSDIWSPALVDWYAGPGWIGWAPIGSAGVGGAAPCTLGVSGCLTAVPRETFGGNPVHWGNPRIINVTTIDGVKTITGPEAPTGSRAATLIATNAADNPVSHENGSRSFVRGADGAPSSVIMGRQVRADAFLSTAFRDTSTPLRITNGLLGGRFNLKAGAPSSAGSATPQIGSATSAARSSAAGSPRVASPQIMTAAERGSGGFGGGLSSFGGRGGAGSAGGSFGGGARGGAAAEGGGGGEAHGGGGGGGSGGHR